MDETEELFKEINPRTSLIFKQVLSFDVNKLITLLGDRIVQTSGKNYALAMDKGDPTDFSNSTTYFDWHSDGLYHSKPPKFVLLHCLDPGDGQAPTQLSNTKKVLNSIDPSSLNTLRKLRSHYVGRGGSTSDHPILDEYKMLLSSRGYVTHLPDTPLKELPSIREIADALTDLFIHLDANAVPHHWTENDILIFNQYQYMHNRKSAGADKNRKLIRMWFN